MFNCCWCDAEKRFFIFFYFSSPMAVLNSLSSISDGAYVCNCWWWLFWILNREEKREENTEKKYAMIRNNWSSQLRLLISFHPTIHIHIHVIHVLLCIWTKKETLPSPDVIFLFKLHFFSSFSWRVLPFNVNLYHHSWVWLNLFSQIFCLNLH